MRVSPITVASALVIVAVIGVWMFRSQESSQYVCRKTGMISYVRTLGPFRTQRIEETPISRALAETGYRKGVKHDWVYAHGRGRNFVDGRFTASGAALSMPTVLRSPDIASAVRLLIAYSDRPTVETWLDRVLDPDTGQAARWTFVDVTEHTNRTDFLLWIKARDEEFKQSVEYFRR